MFLWERTWTRIAFYKSQISRFSRVGIAATEKLNPNQTSFRIISSTITGALTPATDPKQAPFKTEKQENCFSGGERPPFQQACPKISPNLGALPTKCSSLHCVRHPRLAQVKTDGIPGTSCRLKPDFTFQESFISSQNLLMVLTNNPSDPHLVPQAQRFRGLRGSVIQGLISLCFGSGPL